MKALRLWLVALAALGSVLSCEAAGSSFGYGSYASIVERMQKMAEKYPTRLILTTAQERFGVEAVGTCKNVHNESEPCKIWIADITNFDTLDENLDRPQMAVSGELHGDEIIGPQVAVAFIELLLTRYETNESIARIVDTRRLTIVPMANAIGYETRRREEEQSDGSFIDANRDFAFEQESNKCMQTVAGRAFNELFLTHMYRVLITFHGGTNVIGYEWGDTRHCQGRNCVDAPDKLAMATLAERMKSYAGPAGKYQGEYVVGDMGSTVYAVGGGMEDWAYGASWNENPVVCKPSDEEAYPEEKTKYNDATHRCVTYLVETADDKAPEEKSLGTSQDILTTGGNGDGHVPRNLRLLLAVADSLEPYVVVKNLEVRDKSVHCAWFVGGAFTVGETWVEYTVEGADWKARTELKEDVKASFVFNDDVQIFTADFDTPEGGDVLVRAVASRVDEKFGQDAGTGEPQSHFVRARLDPQWQYSHNGSLVQGTEFYQSKTQIYHFDTQQYETVSQNSNAVDWNGLHLQNSPGRSDGGFLVRHIAIIAGIFIGSVLLVAAILQWGRPQWFYEDVLASDGDARSARGYSLTADDDDVENDDVPLRLYA
eukprot:Plantae.Rhodophyta-Purpureofilum_apyrenoidigerum.ctg12813.p1 GENE.Plantae.Rhodophyta-Purpureofilum_apyrenoidigerum.ctg12813~~Plantae.Rhodophyta-Purpureofilum_apyrenoidigerum.ctg12813.p1  ORF type:complete len:600 (-),score=113.66 Plantae.Rhodophyta-Purpureofilum_apyrenoidigerum.ctg12813:121-1920(-)